VFCALCPLSVPKQAKWAENVVQPATLQHASFAKCLIAFAIVEGIFFSLSSVLSSDLNNVAYSMAYALQMSSSVVMKLFSVICLCAIPPLTQPPCSIRIREIVDSAVQIEEPFIREALPFTLMGMNASLAHEPIHSILC
jgi:ribonucleoside-diphosphate reductase subunit M2